MIHHHDIQQGSDEWKAARLGRYTGSNAYKLLSSFGAHDAAKQLDSKFTGNFYTKRGHLLEDEAIELYENIKHTIVSHTGFVTNDDYPDCLYSPDGLTENVVVEVKCFGEKPHMAIYNGVIPLKILAQIHFGMLITGKTHGHLVIYNPKLATKLAYKIIDVPYDQKIQDNFKRILTGVKV